MTLSKGESLLKIRRRTGSGGVGVDCALREPRLCVLCGVGAWFRRHRPMDALPCVRF